MTELSYFGCKVGTKYIYAYRDQEVEHGVITKIENTSFGITVYTETLSGEEKSFYNDSFFYPAPYEKILILDEVLNEWRTLQQQ